jgi:hypothetical protein
MATKSYALQYFDNLKQSRPGKNNPTAEIKTYPPDRRLCPITILKGYLKRTSRMRKTNTLFISYVKPYGAVTRSTISRWGHSLLSGGYVFISAVGLFFPGRDCFKLSQYCRT